MYGHQIHSLRFAPVNARFTGAFVDDAHYLAFGSALVAGPTHEYDLIPICSVRDGSEYVTSNIIYHESEGGLRLNRFEPKVISATHTTVVTCQKDGNTVRVGTVAPFGDGTFIMVLEEGFYFDIELYSGRRETTWEQFVKKELRRPTPPKPTGLINRVLALIGG